jgi:hypothetical protein
MKEKTEEEFAGLFQAHYAVEKYRDSMLKSNYLAGHAFFLRRSKKKRESNNFFW